MQGELRFLIAFLWLMGSAVAATAEILTGQHFPLVIFTLLVGGIGSAMLAEWWCRYYD